MFAQVFRTFALVSFILTSMIGPLSFAKEHENKDTLIPRSILFGDPEYIHVQISPDGKHLAYLAPHSGVLNVWVGSANELKSMRPVTNNQKRRVRDYFFSYNNEYILYIDDQDGNENWRIYRVDIKTGEQITLASFNKVQVRVAAVSPNFPDEILIGLNQRRPDLHDIYRLNVRDGKLTLLYENNNFFNIICDDDFNIRLGIETTTDGGGIWYLLDKDFSKSKLMTVAQADFISTYPITLNKTGDLLYLIDSRGRNTAALTSIDLNTRKSKLLADDKLADIQDVLLQPSTKIPQAYEVNYEKPKWSLLDNTLQKDWNYLKTVSPGEFKVIDRSLDDNTWIIVFLQDDGSPRYYFYDRSKGSARFLFAAKPKLNNLPLTHMDPVIIYSRDKLPLVSYLSLPKDVRVSPAKAKFPVPLVVLVHGGPNARDEWGYDSEHQWLANRGYAVLSINYRGSTGFGKKFVNAGNREWGGKMQDDLVDGAEWAIKQGIAKPNLIAIMGGSYGGYATLMGLTKTPTFFACGVDIVGPSNLETFLKTIPAYWKPFYAEMKIKIGGDPETKEGQAFLASRSPLTFVDKIKRPLLIGQGANDPRVNETEAQQIVSMMESQHIPVTYVLYPDEGHGFARPENRLSFYAVAEAFLSEHLHGKFEPIKNDFENSSIEIKAGKQYLPKSLFPQ